MEAVAEADDELIEKYLEEGTLPEEEIAVGVKAGFARRADRPGDLSGRPRRRSGSTACWRSSPRSSPRRSIAAR